MSNICFASSAWRENPHGVLDDIKSEIDSLLNGRSSGAFNFKVEITDAASVEIYRCVACEKDDLMEWTEPEEHACIKNPTNRQLLNI